METDRRDLTGPDKPALARSLVLSCAVANDAKKSNGNNKGKLGHDAGWASMNSIISSCEGVL